MRAHGDYYHNEFIRQTAFKLISALFYIEIVEEPSFYTSPQICTLRIQCRLTGTPLLQVLSWLQKSRIRIAYKGEGTHFSDTLLCPETLAVNSFCKLIKIRVMTLDTNITVKLGPLDGSYYAISKCPYRLGNLIRDQGFDCFGDMSQLGSDRDSSELQLQLERLIETIQYVL